MQNNPPIVTQENYFDKDIRSFYMSSSTYKNFVGSRSIQGCEAKALKLLSGEWQETPSKALLIGAYVDAHFQGTLATFKAHNPKIFKKDGTLYSDFEHANTMIARAESDEYFMSTMKGEKQKIFTAEMFGCWWVCAIDSYLDGIAIVDLKTTASIQNPIYADGIGKVSFMEAYSYDVQLAIYQEIVRINTGKRLPCFISVVSKENPVDIGVFTYDDETLYEALGNVESNMNRIIALKSGEIKPRRCEKCDYCVSTKVLFKAKHYSECIEEK